MELEFEHIVSRFIYHNERDDVSISDMSGQLHVDFSQKNIMRVGMEILNDEELSINKVAKNWSCLAIFTKKGGSRKGSKIRHISLYLNTLKSKL